MTTEFYDWLQQGVDKGWITDPYCDTHEGYYDSLTEEEIAEFEEGGDPCIVAVRILNP